MDQPELRPMGVGDILDAALRLYRSHFVTYLMIGLIAYVPGSLAIATIQSAAAPPTVHAPIPGSAELGSGQMTYDVESGSRLGPILGGLGGMMIWFLLVYPLCIGALVHSISAGYLGEELGAVDSFRRALPRLLRLILAQFLATIVVMIGLVLLVVPGVIFSLWFLVLAPVAMLEQRGVTGTLKRSRELMRGNTGKGFAVSLVLGFVGVIFANVTVVCVALVPWPHPFLQAFATQVANCLILPIQTAPYILLYYDLRIRKEAFDLERLAQDLGTVSTA